MFLAIINPSLINIIKQYKRMGTNNEETHQKNTTEIILEYISVIEMILLYMNG